MSENNNNETTNDESQDDREWDTLACVCGDNLHATISRRDDNQASETARVAMTAYILMNGLSY